MYERILEAAADAIVTVNEAQEIVHFNRGAEHIFGYEKAEVLGSNLNRLLPAQFRAHHAEYVEAFGRSPESARLMGHRREVFGLRKDGSEFPAEASILKLDAPDGRRLYTALVRDVTDRKKMEQQQQFLADVSVALSGSLDYEATLDSVVRLPIPALADLCVLEVSDESGRTKRRVFPRSGGDEIGAVTQTLSLVARGQVVGSLTLMRAGAGIAFDPGYRMIAENFAARAALAIDNARLYQDAQRATRARDEVLGVVSHDLRNPLSAIAMCSRVLMDNPPVEASARHELARTIHESTSWMSRMIQDLLDVSAIEAGVLSLICTSEEIVPILNRVSDLFTRAAADRDVKLTLKVDSQLPRVRADAERLVQAVANLVGNAVKFTGARGGVAIGACVKADEIEITVSDTGRGIAEQDLPHIFDRYWHSRSRASGTGLGLAIARGIVEAHGGRITVRSKIGSGTQFSILLPREDCNERAVAKN
jgi:PAS domain S-box-containing protein